jgi:hypothetical protein
LRGVTHTHPRFLGAPPCGGQVFAEFFAGESKVDYDEPSPPSWECYCEKCLDCDPNGWDTLRECVREAPAYWCQSVPASC